MATPIPKQRAVFPFPRESPKEMATSALGVLRGGQPVVHSRSVNDFHLESEAVPLHHGDHIGFLDIHH